jgi:hypothetical protein
MVAGLEAVAATDVANARRGEATSSTVSAPSRTRKASRSERAQDDGAEERERRPQRLDGEQRRGAGRPACRVQRVDERDAGADRQSDGPTTA